MSTLHKSAIRRYRAGVRAVLFDVDGVLLDSAARHRAVWSHWCKMRGLSFELVWAATHGRRPTETVAEVAAHLDPQVEHRVLVDLLAAARVVAPAFPGAAELLATLPQSQWAVVTSGQRATVGPRFASAGLPSPAVVVAGDDVRAGKPDPEGYLRAAEALHVAAADCLVVEDAPSGIAAGKAAGMTVLAIATTHGLADLRSADEGVLTLLAAKLKILAWTAA